MDNKNSGVTNLSRVKNANNIQINTQVISSHGNTCAIASVHKEHKIDLSSYTKLIVKADATLQPNTVMYPFRISLMTVNPDGKQFQLDALKYMRYEYIEASGIYEFDVSDVNTEVYICFVVGQYAAFTQNNCTLHYMYLE